MFLPVVIDLGHEFVLVLNGAGTDISQLVLRTIGKRNELQIIVGRRAEAAGWDLITREWCLLNGILKLGTIRCRAKTTGVEAPRAVIGKITIPFSGGRNES